MKLLEIWVATPLARALGWTLLHSLWEGALISAALGLVLGLTRSARARYAAACIAMLSLVSAIGITFLLLMPEEIHGLGAAAPLALPWNVPPLHTIQPASSGLAAAVPWLAPLWMLGVWVFVLAQIAGWISVSRLRTRGVCCAPDRWQNELARLRARLRLSRPIQLLESCLADVPMVIGHIRPVILMPIGLLAGLPANQVEAILLHELAHIRRCDYLVNVVQRAVESLLFYHPAAWWISRVIRTERENCCDDIVVATSGDAQEYAVALTAIEEHRWAGRQAALAATGGNLMKRIHRLLYPKAANAVWVPLLAAIVLTTTAVAAFAAWPAPPHARSAAHAQNSGTPKPDHKDRLGTADRQTAERKPEKPLVCTFASTTYPEGTIIQEGDGPEQMCVRALDESGPNLNGAPTYHPEWIRTSQAIRTRSATVVHIPVPAPAVCAPKSSDKQGLCACQDGGYSSPNATANSAKGPFQLRCGFDGKWSETKTPNVVRNKDSSELRAPESGNKGFKFVCSYCTAKEVPVSGEKGRTAFLVTPIESSPSNEEGQQGSVRPDTKDSNQSQVPESGKNGYSYPKCIDCPQPKYTEDAARHKFQGSMKLNVVISAEGRVERIKAVKPLPYGLTRSAIEAVKNWKFKPANGPDGKPATVRQMIEISFHMY